LDRLGGLGREEIRERQVNKGTEKRPPRLGTGEIIGPGEKGIPEVRDRSAESTKETILITPIFARHEKEDTKNRGCRLEH